MSTCKFRLVIDDPGPIRNINIATRNFVEKARDMFGQFAELLSQEMRFSYEAIRHDIGEVLQANGNWTGVIGMLNRSEVDIAVMPLFLSEERSQAVTYSYSFTISDVTFVTKKTEYNRNEFGAFLVFSKSVWIALCLAVLAVALLNYVLQRQTYSFKSVIFNTLSITLRQPGVIKSSTTPGYLLWFSWIIATAFLSMSYTSVLLSYLSVPILKGVRDVPQLAKAVEEKSYLCMTVRGSNIPLTLSQSKSKAMELIGKNMEENPNGYGYVEDFIRNSRKNIAYIQPREDISFLDGKLFVSEDSFFLTIGAIAMRKDFCCKDKLDRGILAITEAGLYQKLQRGYDFAVALTEVSFMPTHVEFPRKLSLRKLSGAFVILIAGYLISILMLCLEIRFSK